MNAWCSGSTAATRSKPGGRLRGCLAAGQGVKGFFVQVGRFKQERQGSFKGLRNVLHLSFREGLALPVVRSDRKEIETPDLSDSSFFVMCRSSSSRSTFVKKM